MIATGPPLVLVGLTAVIVNVALSPASGSVSFASRADCRTLTPTVGNRWITSAPATGGELTVTVKEQVMFVPSASVAMHVTVLTPVEKLDPLGGVQTDPVIGQLTTVGAVQLIFVMLWPDAVVTTMFDGQTKSS